MSTWQFAATVVFSFGVLIGMAVVWIGYVLPDRKLRKAVMRMIELSDVDLAFRLFDKPGDRMRLLEAELSRLKDNQ